MDDSKVTDIKQIEDFLSSTKISSLKVYQEKQNTHG